jgi:hypothetical protein
VGTQPESIKLKRESFQWIRKFVLEGIEEPSHLYALIMSIVINDLGETPQLALEYHNMSGEDISGASHDMVLLKSVKIGLVHCLSRLVARHTADLKADIVNVMELGAGIQFWAFLLVFRD